MVRAPSAGGPLRTYCPQFCTGSAERLYVVEHVLDIAPAMLALVPRWREHFQGGVDLLRAGHRVPRKVTRLALCVAGGLMQNSPHASMSLRRFSNKSPRR